MKEQNVVLKLIFGGVIFLFSAAFAYFAASYLQQEDVFNYWLVLFIFAVAYIIVGELKMPGKRYGLLGVING